MSKIQNITALEILYSRDYPPVAMPVLLHTPVGHEVRRDRGTFEGGKK